MSSIRGTHGIGAGIEAVKSRNPRGTDMKTTNHRDWLVWALCALAGLAVASALVV